MTDELAHRLGLEAADIADLDRLLALMHDAPQPPNAGPEDDPEPPSASHPLRGCSIALLIAIAVGVVVIGLGATSSGPGPNDPTSSIPSNVNTAY